MDTISVYIGRTEFIGTPEGTNTDAKRAALCAKARELSSVGERKNKRPVNPRTAALIEQNERLAQRIEAARQGIRAAGDAVYGRYGR